MIKNIMKSIVGSLLGIMALLFLSSSFSEAAELLDLATIGVKEYSVDGGMLTPGSDINLNVTLYNPSKSNSADNIMVTIIADKKQIYPIYGSDNQVYVGSINAKNEKTVTIPLTVSNIFSDESVSIECNITYTTNGMGRSNSTNIIIPSSGGNLISVKSVEVAGHAVVGGRSLISIRYDNQSNMDIRDAKLLIDGNVVEDYKEILVDTIRAKKDYLKDYYVCFLEPGNQSISIKFEYTDAEGNLYSEDLGTFDVSVSKSISSESEVVQDSIPLNLIGLGVIALSALIMLIAIIGYAKKHA